MVHMPCLADVVSCVLPAVHIMKVFRFFFLFYACLLLSHPFFFFLKFCFPVFPISDLCWLSQMVGSPGLRVEKQESAEKNRVQNEVKDNFFFKSTFSEIKSTEYNSIKTTRK